jgi:hypothetical protein
MGVAGLWGSQIARDALSPFSLDSLALEMPSAAALNIFIIIQLCVVFVSLLLTGAPSDGPVTFWATRIQP